MVAELASTDKSRGLRKHEIKRRPMASNTRAFDLGAYSARHVTHSVEHLPSRSFGRQAHAGNGVNLTLQSIIYRKPASSHLSLGPEAYGILLTSRLSYLIVAFARLRCSRCACEPSCLARAEQAHASAHRQHHPSGSHQTRTSHPQHQANA